MWCGISKYAIRLSKNVYIENSIEDNCTVVGNPGKVIKKGDKSV